MWFNRLQGVSLPIAAFVSGPACHYGLKEIISQVKIGGEAKRECRFPCDGLYLWSLLFIDKKSKSEVLEILNREVYNQSFPFILALSEVEHLKVTTLL